MNWILFATKVPAIVAGIMGIVAKVKASGEDKKAAVLAAVPESFSLAEFAAGKDIFNDESIQKLLSAYVDAEAAAMKAREALKQGILNKSK